MSPLAPVLAQVWLSTQWRAAGGRLWAVWKGVTRLQSAGSPYASRDLS